MSLLKVIHGRLISTIAENDGIRGTFESNTISTVSIEYNKFPFFFFLLRRLAIFFREPLPNIFSRTPG